MLGQLLGIGEEAVAVRGILECGLAARPRARDRPDRHLAVAHPDQDLGARADDRKSVELQQEQER